MTSPARVIAISRNGQVSLPLEVRARWKTRRVVILDLGDRVVMRPVPDQPIEEFRGNYRGRGPTADEARQQERQQDAERADGR